MNLISGRRGRLTHDAIGESEDWDDYPIGGGFLYEPDNSAEHFDMLDMGEVEITSSGGGFGAQTRWAVLTPLACTIVYRIDSIDNSVEEPEWSEGDEEQSIVLPDVPAFVDLPSGGVDDGYRMILVKVIWHPWT